MRTLILLPTLIAIFATSPLALAVEAVEATATVTTVKPWYIGPKGGDSRKGNTTSPIEHYASIRTDPIIMANGNVGAAQNAWFVGPKGGDIRKGNTILFTKSLKNDRENGFNSTVYSAPTTPTSRYIGPKWRGL